MAGRGGREGGGWGPRPVCGDPGSSRSATETKHYARILG
jgi:hypothetical protein